MGTPRGEEIIWNETEFKLKFVLDNPNFSLPQIVRVVQGYMVDEDDSIASGLILTLHGKNKTDCFLGIDGHGKDVNISTNCPYRVKVVSLGNDRQFKSVNEICFCENPPKYIRNIENLTTAHDTILKSSTTLEVLDQVLSETGDVIGLNCKVDVDGENKIENEVVLLPLNLKETFVETIPKELADKDFLLSDIQQTFQLPIKVQFLPVAEKKSGYGPQLGNIVLQKTFSVNSILATSVIDGVCHAISFSADLPITIQVAKGLINTHPIESQKDKIDLKRFEYMSRNDPHSSFSLQNIVYEELKTPLLQRHENFRNQDSFRNFSLPPKRSSHCTSSFSESAITSSRSSEKVVPRKRNKSLDFGNNIENFVKTRLSFKSLRKFRKPKEKSQSKNVDLDYDDAQSTCTFLTSDDGNSSSGICSIDIRSDESSESTYDTSFSPIVQSMDSISLDTQSIPSVNRQSNLRRKVSSDSGICLAGRKKTQTRLCDRLHSRATTDALSSSGNSTIDNISEWSVPFHVKESPMSERKNMTSQKTSASYLWSATDTHDTNDNNNNSNNTNANFMGINISNERVNNSKKTYLVTPSPLNQAHIKSIEEIRALNEEGVAEILELLKLNEFKENFQENQINGELLLDLEQADFVTELNLSLFQAKKIIKYIKGWRPESEHKKASETSRRNSLNPRDWSENDVFLHMSTINLVEFAKFCKQSQVNGDLLLDILDKETLSSLKADHGVNMTSLESKKLLNFVVKGWRPDSSSKKTTGV